MPTTGINLAHRSMKKEDPREDAAMATQTLTQTPVVQVSEVVVENSAMTLEHSTVR
jgi:hypothetical protein